MRPWAMHQELEVRVQKCNRCECAACFANTSHLLRYNKKARLWLRYSLPLTY